MFTMDRSERSRWAETRTFTHTAAIPTSTGSSESKRASSTRREPEAILYRIQQLMHEKAMCLPI
jgi:hypothetical protein